jgi:NADH-quinone oxidoreductase subunit G
MEFLLLNHPIDCPICDQAGECGLQNYYMDYGLYNNRSTVPKVEKQKVVDVGPLVVLDQERCILCSRCVRFTNEITKTSELMIAGRGENCRIETFPGKDLDNPYSGNVVDICPVGALTSKDFRFKKRVWWLSTAKSICTGCARGCNIEIDYQKTTTYRYRPRYNPDVNSYWMCDEGRLSYKRLHENRLEQPVLQGQEVTLERALQAAAESLQAAFSQHGSQAVVVIGSSTATLEDNFLLSHLAQQTFGDTAVYAPNFVPPGEADNLLRMADQTPNSAGVKFLGFNPQADALIQALSTGKVKVVVSLDNSLEDMRIQSLLEIHKPQIVYLGTHRTALALRADIAIPLTLQAEHYASYISAGDVLQKVHQAYHAPWGAQPGWMSIKEVFRPLLTAPPLFEDVEDVWTALRGKHSVLGSLTFYDIPDTGFKLVQEEIPVA